MEMRSQQGGCRGVGWEGGDVSCGVAAVVVVVVEGAICMLDAKEFSACAIFFFSFFFF